MNIPAFLRSFAVVAGAALCLALLAGLLIGSITSQKTRPLPDIAAAPPPRHRPDLRPQGRETVQRSLPKQPDVLPRNGKPPTQPDPPKHKTTTPVVFDVPPVRPDVLPEGRTDPIATLDKPVEIKGSILVQVRSFREQPVAFATLKLDVDGGPLGWLAVRNATPERTEQAGEWRYSNIMAGRYRVSAAAAGYTPAIREFEIAANALSITVDLRLEQARQVTIEFALQLEDGSIPQDVQISWAERGEDPNLVRGRFGEHALGNVGVAGHRINSTRYKLPDTGIVPWTVNSGMDLVFEFSHEKERKLFHARQTVEAGTDGRRFNLRLAPVDADADIMSASGPSFIGSVEITFKRADGGPLTISRANMRSRPDSPDYLAPAEQRGATAVWTSLHAGRWWAVMEAQEFDAPFAGFLNVTQNTTHTFTVEVGRLTVRAGRDPGSPARSGAMSFNLRIRPRGSGALESSFSRELPDNQQGDSATYLLPAGPYVLLGQPADKATGVEPPQRSVTVSPGGASTVDFIVRAACTLSFVCVDDHGRAIAGVEYLLSFSPAGQLSEEEKSKVKLSGADGRCLVPGAPYGAVYLHIWTSSSEWHRPDRVFRIEMPAYGEKDLGAIILNR